MSFKCPGSHSFSQPHPEYINCPFCKKEIEIWSDEVKAKCPGCKKVILREGGPSCLDWCKYGKECVGEETYNKYITNKKESEQKKKKEK